LPLSSAVRLALPSPITFTQRLRLGAVISASLYCQFYSLRGVASQEGWEQLVGKASLTALGSGKPLQGPASNTALRSGELRAWQHNFKITAGLGSAQF
jgi:hypothetical protein